MNKSLLLTSALIASFAVQAGMPTRARVTSKPPQTVEQKAADAAAYKAAQAQYQASHPATPKPALPLAPVTVCSYC